MHENGRCKLSVPQIKKFPLHCKIFITHFFTLYPLSCQSHQYNNNYGKAVRQRGSVDPDLMPHIDQGAHCLLLICILFQILDIAKFQKIY